LHCFARNINTFEEPDKLFESILQKLPPEPRGKVGAEPVMGKVETDWDGTALVEVLTERTDTVVRSTHKPET
jgi:hypothetical protein